MANFLTDLFNSIFTPGPTPTLLVATNASFAALQLVLLALLILTYSVHFLILSCLSAGLWWAINWFVTELRAANEKEKEAEQLRDLRRDRDERTTEDSGTETEPTEIPKENVEEKREKHLQPKPVENALRKRRSLGEASGDISTDSEWDKVEEEGDMDK